MRGLNSRARQENSPQRSPDLRREILGSFKDRKIPPEIAAEIERTVMTKSEVKKKGKEEGTKKITFRCRFCEQDKPLDEMRFLNRFFPPLVACQACEKEMR